MFPFPYVEQEAVSFYKRSFGEGFNWKLLPFRIVQFPFNLIAEGFAEVGTVVEWLWGGDTDETIPLNSHDTWKAALNRKDTELRFNN